MSDIARQSGELDRDEGSHRKRDERASRQHDLSWSLFEALLDADLWPPNGVKGKTQKDGRRVRQRRR
jgi:hypothetical protein